MEVHDGLIDLYTIVQRLYNLYYGQPNGNPFPSVFVRELLAILQKVRPLDRHQ